MKTHIIENGIVTNTILATVQEAQAAFPGAVCIDGAIGGIGWTWDGETLTAPPAPPTPIPQSVTMRQARLALLAAGLLDLVETAIASAGPAAKIEWDYATEVQRGSGWVPAMATALGMTDAQIDALFVQAATL